MSEWSCVRCGSKTPGYHLLCEPCIGIVAEKGTQLILDDTPRIRTTEHIAQQVLGMSGVSPKLNELDCKMLISYIVDALDLERKRAEGLVKALSFYADWKNWSNGGFEGERSIIWNGPSLSGTNVAQDAIAAYKQEPS